METFLSFLSRHRYDIIRAAAALGVNALVLLLLPAVIMANSSATAGMLSCIALFFAADPVLCAAAGIFAGRDIRHRWFTALFPPLMFLLSVRVIFGGDTGLTVYAVIYSAITALVTLFTFLVKNYSPGEG